MSNIVKGQSLKQPQKDTENTSVTAFKQMGFLSYFSLRGQGIAHQNSLKGLETPFVTILLHDELELKNCMV